MIAVQMAAAAAVAAAKTKARARANQPARVKQQSNKKEVVEVKRIHTNIKTEVVGVVIVAAAAVDAVIVLVFSPVTENNTLTSKFTRRFLWALWETKSASRKIILLHVMFSDAVKPSKLLRSITATTRFVLTKWVLSSITAKSPS